MIMNEVIVSLTSGREIAVHIRRSSVNIDPLSAVYRGFNELHSCASVCLQSTGNIFIPFVTFKICALGFDSNKFTKCH